MNKKMYSFFAIIGMVIAIGAAAFTAPKASEKVDNQNQIWFYMEDTPDNHDNPASYRLGELNDHCQGASEVICTISAPEDGNSGLPDLSSSIVESKKP